MIFRYTREEGLLRTGESPNKSPEQEYAARLWGRGDRGVDVLGFYVEGGWGVRLWGGLSVWG